MEQSLFYNNNNSLKKSGVEEQFTDEHVQELTRCFQDVAYFVRNYIYIVSLDEGRVLFNLYDYEKEMIDVFHNNRFCVVRAGRQLGKCLKKSINIRVRNKKTGDIYEQPIGDFYNERRAERDLQESDGKVE